MASDLKKDAQFNPLVRKFNSQNMAYLAQCARAAYNKLTAEEDPSQADSTDSLEIKQELTKFLGYDFNDSSTKFFALNSRQTETQGYVVGDEEKIIIAFRGTKETLDWAANSKLFQETWTATRKIGKVHIGFYQAFTSVCSKMEDYIKLLRTNDQPIWVTGHSLGGALATLAAAHIELQMSNEFETAGGYTFGQPRVGNDDFADAFDERLKGRFFRIMNKNDVVCVIPPKIFTQPSKIAIPKPIRYKHLGTPVFFNDKGEMVYDANWFERVGGRVKGIVGDFAKDFVGDTAGNVLGYVTKGEKIDWNEMAKLEVSTIRNHSMANCYLPLAKEHLQELSEEKLSAENKVD